MAELTFKSAGVSTREIDLTGPTQVRPQGIPAGIIGTAQKGPAFVPITFATYQDFMAEFGGTDGERFGPLAVHEWMRNARAGTYVRILGVGDGQKKNTTTGLVANAGHVIGSTQVQSNGQIGNNPYMAGDLAAANATATIAVVDPSKIETGTGAIISRGLLTAGSGIALTNPNYGVGQLKTSLITITLPTSFKDTAGVAFAAHTILLTDAIDVTGLATGAQCRISIQNGGGGDLTGTQQVAELIVEAFKGNSAFDVSAYRTAGNATYAATIDYGDDWKLNALGGSDDTSSALIATLEGTTGVKLQLRGTMGGGSGYADKDGRFGGAIDVSTSLSIGAGAAANICHTVGDQGNEVVGSSTSNQTVTVTGRDGTAGALLVTANAAVDGFMVGATATLTAAALRTALDTKDSDNDFTFTESPVGTVKVVPLSAEAGLDGDEGNENSIQQGNKTLGALLLNAVDTADDTATLFTGGGDAAPDSGLGRTYFLGCFMAGAAGTTHYVDAGFRASTAEPQIRGVLFSPQGVNLGLSTTNLTNNEPQSTFAATGEFGTGASDDGGFMTGSIDLATGKQEFIMLLNGHAKSITYPNIMSASFDPNAANYFWNVFNTDPTLVEKAGHYLHAHWDAYPSHHVVTGTNAIHGQARTGDKHELAFLLTGSQGRNAGTAVFPNYENFETRYRTAFSPWVTSQKFGGKANNLFKVHALDDGAVANSKFKISVENIAKSNNESAPFGSFDLVVREFGDDDDNPVVFERWVKLSLDAGSERYISRVIGDRYAYYDFDKNEGAQKLVIEGTHPNKSKYIRVSVTTEVKNATENKAALPCGFRGHHHLVTSGTNYLATNPIHNDASGGPTADTRTLWRATQMPVPMRDNIALGVSPKKRPNASLYWGVQFQVKDSKTEPNKNRNLDKSLASYTKWFPNHRLDTQDVWVGDNQGTVDTNGTVLDSDRFNNNFFSLENVQVKTSSIKDIPDSKQWAEASYRRNATLDGGIAGSRFLDVVKDFGELSVKKYLKFSFFMQGGFDGLNPFDEEKTKMTDAAARREMTDSTNQKGVKDSTVSAYRKAIDVMEEKSDVDIQLLATPGMRVKEITDYAIDSVENRFDAMYIMDLTEYDNLLTVVTSSADQKTSVTNTVDKFLSRNLDTSFAAAYFPDVVITDPATLTNVQCPPSVAVLGAFALNDAVAHPWFAPAGFTRGALSSVVESQVKLSRNNLDDLYAADINPLTAFPHTPGVVVFGQKTLQAHASALDRVNVRRLLIEIRRQVKRVGNSLLFEPNREDTLARFSSAVNPILQRIQQQQGLDRFKVVIDTTTTTQADVENNTLRGKIFLQPTRAVEFISLDFVITNAGTEV
jgi:phage tail sheath protein FI